MYTHTPFLKELKLFVLTMLLTRTIYQQKPQYQTPETFEGLVRVVQMTAKGIWVITVALGCLLGSESVALLLKKPNIKDT